MKDSKRFWSILLVIIMLFVSVPVSTAVVSSAENDIASLAEAPVYYIETYEQLKAHALNAQSDCRYILNCDIEQEDNTNNNEIVISSNAYMRLDLNGYSIRRSTMGNDCALFRINSGGAMTIMDTSTSQTGYCSFSEGYSTAYKAVFHNSGDLEILGGYYEIFSPYEQGSCSIIRAMSGSTYIHDGTFDSSAAWGGETISVGHDAYLYEVPRVVIYGGEFYGKQQSIDVTPFGNYLVYGCLFPSVYVLGGDFYVTSGGKSGDDANFAYCNNGWGRVIVAEGVVYYKCLNSRDQRFLQGVSKEYFTETIDDFTGSYYKVTAPPMIVSDKMDYYYRLHNLCRKEDVKSYGDSIYELHKEEFDEILGSIDTLVVSETEKEAPLLKLRNRTTNHQYVNWYMCNESDYNGEDTQWTYIGDAFNVSAWQPEERPEGSETHIVRCVVTNSDLSTYEDIIRIVYMPLKGDEIITSVSVTDVNIPIAGETPDFTVTPEDGFCINGVYWTDATNPKNRINMKETDAFEAGHTYELEIWIRANENYKFSTDSDGWIDISAVIGGKDAEVILPGSEISAELLVTYTVAENTEESSTPTTSEDPSDNTSPDAIGILGDANCDEKVNIKDATAIQKHAAGLITLEGDGLTLADADTNTKVNVKDATAIQKFIAGIETGFAIGEILYR